MKAEVRSADAGLRSNRKNCSVITCLFADDTMLLAESKDDLQRLVNEFYSVCRRRKLKVNAGKNKVKDIERREGEVMDFNAACRVSTCQ